MSREEHERAFWVDAKGSLSREVFAADQAPVPTGILDAAGRPIMRAEPPRRVGFRIPEPRS